MSKKDKDNNENNVIKNSVYLNSLNRLLKLYNENSENLQNKIKNLKESASCYFLVPICVFFCALMLLAVLSGITNNDILSISISSGSFIISIPITTIVAITNKHARKIANNQLNTIETIENYLKSELEISKEYKNLLSNIQILDKEKIHTQQIDDILNNRISLPFLNDKYLEEYRKNLIIIDSLKDLDDKQKENYLKNIYNQIGTDFTTKKNININDNDELTSIDSNSQKMLTTNANSNSVDETLNHQDKSLQSHQMGVSLNKDDYTINNPNELINIFNNCGDEDILPPKAQEELAKGHQLSKKF